MICQGCKNDFNTKSRVPKLLQCGHTLCLSCLQLALPPSGNPGSIILTCPNCNGQCSYASLKSIRTNYGALSLLESPNTANAMRLSLQTERKARNRPASILKKSDSVMKPPKELGLICRTHMQPMSFICCTRILCPLCAASPHHYRHNPRGLSLRDLKPFAALTEAALGGLFNLAQMDLATFQGCVEAKDAYLAALTEREAVATAMIAMWENELNSEVRQLSGRLVHTWLENFRYGEEQLELLADQYLPEAEGRPEHWAAHEQFGVDENGMATGSDLAQLLAEEPQFHYTQCVMDYMLSCCLAILHLDLHFHFGVDLIWTRTLLLPEDPSLLQGTPTPARAACICWNWYGAYLLRYLTLARFHFVSKQFKTEELRLTPLTAEQAQLTDFAFVASSKDTTLYLLGGLHPILSEVTASCFSVSTGGFSRIASLRKPKCLLGAVHFQERLFAFGGRVLSQGEETRTQDIEQYHCTLDLWRLFSVQLPEPLYDIQAVSVGPNMILLCGGRNGLHQLVPDLCIVDIQGHEQGRGQDQGQYQYQEPVIQRYPETLTIINQPTVLQPYFYNNKLNVLYDESIMSDALSLTTHYRLQQYSTNGQLDNTIALSTITSDSGPLFAQHNGLMFVFTLAQDPAKPLEQPTWTHSIIFNFEGDSLAEPPAEALCRALAESDPLPLENLI